VMHDDQFVNLGGKRMIVGDDEIILDWHWNSGGFGDRETALPAVVAQCLGLMKSFSEMTVALQRGAGQSQSTT
jgi:hypothetical protein